MLLFVYCRRKPHSRRDTLDRYRIIIYHKLGLTNTQISQLLKCDRKTARRWIQQYENNKNVEEKHRTGRKRKLSEVQVNDIVDYTKKVKFTTPSLIKFHFSLNVSKRTIDRRLIEHNLYGRVGNINHVYIYKL